MNSLFDTPILQEVLQRIDKLEPQQESQWGKMTVDQMLKHCQYPLEVANGKVIFKDKPGAIKKMVFKLFKSSMYNDEPWKHNLPTVKEFKVTDRFSFENEKESLINKVQEFHKKDLNLHWPEHPYFGNFTTEQWGKMQYKHLDHHLRQFGV